MYELYKDKGITKVVGIESRGFIMGAILARKLDAGLIICRKPGKLPAETISQSYGKEYGKDTIEIHKDAINEDDIVLIHDDLLATGGTIIAATAALKEAGAVKVSVACTHGVFINNALERFNGSPIDSVVCCNTLNNAVSRISVAELVAGAVKDAYAGKW